MEVAQVADPTDEQVDTLHAAYIIELRQLFETHKSKYGVGKDQHLSIL